MRSTSSASSRTVVAVTVLIGGWGKGTRQYAGLQRSRLKCVQDPDQASEPFASSDGLAWVMLMSLMAYLRRSVCRQSLESAGAGRARESTGAHPGRRETRGLARGQRTDDGCFAW